MTNEIYRIPLPGAFHREYPLRVWPLENDIVVEGQKYKFSKTVEGTDKKTGCPTALLHFRVNPLDIDPATGNVTVGPEQRDDKILNLGEAIERLNALKYQQGRINEIFGRSDVDRSGYEKSYQSLSGLSPMLQDNIKEFNTGIDAAKNLLEKNQEAGKPSPEQKEGASCHRISSTTKLQPLT